MTLREKIADWLTGGRYGVCRDLREMYFKSYTRKRDDCFRLEDSLASIHAYTSTQKSGTAQKVTRMCEEALK